MDLMFAAFHFERSVSTSSSESRVEHPLSPQTLFKTARHPVQKQYVLWRNKDLKHKTHKKQTLTTKRPPIDTLFRITLHPVQQVFILRS